jgi:hypothetical protein
VKAAELAEIVVVCFGLSSSSFLVLIFGGLQGGDTLLFLVIAASVHT